MPDAPNAFPAGPDRGRPDRAVEDERGAREQRRRLVLACELVDDDRLLDALADRLADRLAARLSAVEPPPALLDAREVARRTGKTRRWVYDHARELGAVALGSGTRPRLGFSPDVIAQLKAAPQPAASTPPLPLRVTPCRRRGATSRSRTVEDLLNGPRPVIGARASAGGQR
jgi:hypothetical protein